LFVALDRQSTHLMFVESFEPRRLGAKLLSARSAPIGEIPRRDTVLELAIVAILLLWWSGWLVFPSVVLSVKVELGAGSMALFFPVAALCIADLLRLCVDLVFPYRTRPRVGIAIAINAAWLVLIMLAFTSPDLLQAAPSVEEPGEIVRVVAIAERVFRAVLLAIGLWTTVLLAVDVVRLLRR
jgi:hypothetical protein